MLTLLQLNLKWIIRDRILQALAAVSLFLMLLIPPMSALSMRQTQEMAVTLALSFISFSLLIFALALGSTIVWRDIERRYSFSVLSLPVNRSSYILAKFSAVALILLFAAIIMGLCSYVAITVTSLQYPSQIPLQWGMIALAIFMDALKSILLAAFAILVTTIATSFFMPFFSSLAIFLAGSASQDVYDFVTSVSGEKLSQLVRSLAKIVYFVLPNFSAFNFKLQAIYPISTDLLHLTYVVFYWFIYTGVVISSALILFSRRELV